jgi:hypothetical protein
MKGKSEKERNERRSGPLGTGEQNIPFPHLLYQLSGNGALKSFGDNHELISGKITNNPRRGAV